MKPSPSPKKSESLATYLANRAEAMPEPGRGALLRQARLLAAATRHSGGRQGLGETGALEILWRLGTVLNAVYDDDGNLRR